MDNKSDDYCDCIIVKDSNIHGLGIFTTADIPKDSLIMIIAGEVISGDECERREVEEDNVYIFWNGDDCYIDTATTEIIKYLNHKCDFNCDVVERDTESLSLIAFRDIKADEELTIDYGYEEIYEDCKCALCNP